MWEGALQAPWREAELLEETKAGGGDNLCSEADLGEETFPSPQDLNAGGVSPIYPRALYYHPT